MLKVLESSFSIYLAVFFWLLMASLLLKRRQDHALLYLLLKTAAYQGTAAKQAGFQTIDGEMVPYATGQQAIRSGTAVLIGGLLVGTIVS